MGVSLEPFSSPKFKRHGGKVKPGQEKNNSQGNVPPEGEGELNRRANDKNDSKFTEFY